MDIKEDFQKKHKIKYINLPRKFKLKDYQNAVTKFIEKYSAHPDILSIYLFGDVSVVGISDLDFIVVLEDRLTVPLTVDYSVSYFEEDLRYLYNNTQPFLMNKNVFQNFWKIFPTKGLKLAYSKEIDLATAGDFKKDIYDILILIDVCNYWYPHLFLRQLLSPTLKVRYSLLILNALRFPLRICQRLLGEKIGLWEEFIEKTTKFRKQWFQLEEFEKHKELRVLLEEAGKISLDLIKKVDDYINENLWTLSLGYNLPRVKKIGEFELNSYIFLSSFSPRKMWDTILNVYNKTGNFVSLLPATFYFPLRGYCQEKGVISQHISHHLSGKRNCFILKNPEIREIIKSRIELMNAHALWYKDNGIQINMMHGYYGYNSLAPENAGCPLSVNGRIRRKIRRIRNILYWDFVLMNSGISVNKIKEIVQIFKLVLQ